MLNIPDSVQKLIDVFNRLPGIGPKSATRLVFYLLQTPEAFTKQFSEILIELKKETGFCPICNNLSEKDKQCSICSNPARNNKTIMVVEDVVDAIAMENIGDYQGVYHILGGVISPVHGIGPDEINLSKLVTRVKENDATEVILATNPTLEGEATAMYIKQLLNNVQGLNLTRIARGIPTGADLDYADRITLKRALDGRTVF